MGAAVPAQRAEQAWTEGVAIWVAVLVVSLVGACKRLMASSDASIAWLDLTVRA